MKIFSENEWSPLRECVVGNVFDTFSFNTDLSFRLFFKDNLKWGYTQGAKQRVHIKHQYIEELTEDLDALVKALEKNNVLVHRPNKMEQVTRIKTPYWESDCLPALNVRDQTIIIGDTILETVPMQRNRLFENDLLKSIFYEAFRDGAHWQKMPQSSLSKDSLLNNSEMMIDGACMVRFGKDIIINVSNASHLLAYKWLVRQFPAYNFHMIESLVDNHLDSFVVPLNEGTLLLRDSSFLEKMPEFLKDWKIIYAPEPTENQFPEYQNEDIMLTSPFIDMNVLSLDGRKIITNSLFPELSELLYKNGFDPIPVQHRHRRIFAGGFHCFTLDLRRN